MTVHTKYCNLVCLTSQRATIKKKRAKKKKKSGEKKRLVGLGTASRFLHSLHFPDDVLYYTIILYYTILYYTILPCTILYYTILYYTVSKCHRPRRLSLNRYLDEKTAGMRLWLCLISGETSWRGGSPTRRTSSYPSKF